MSSATSAPGAIAVNGAIVVGYKLAGILGAAVASIATILPPFAIISLISLFYAAFRENIWIAALLQGMQAGVGAVIASVVVQMGADVLREHDPLSDIILIAAFAAALLGVNVVLVILACGVIGIIRTRWAHRPAAHTGRCRKERREDQ